MKKKYIILLLIIIGIFSAFYFLKKEDTQAFKDCGTCKTPEEAFAETQKALNIISNNINCGIKSASYLKEYENTKNKIFKK